MTATAKITTYRRNSASVSYGYIDKGDTVLVLGTKGDFTQVKYPVGNNSYKYAFIKTSDANNYLGTGSSSTNTTTSWQWPVVSNRSVTQSFGNYSSRMASTGRPYHCGIDLVGSSTICAAANGTVKYKGYTSGNGNHIVISHTLNGQTVYTLYSHLSSYSDCPAVGKSVTKGQKIGVMGTTGNSTGIHLHFGVFTGYSSDPYGYTNQSGTSRVTYKGITFYNPSYVIANGKLP